MDGVVRVLTVASGSREFLVVGHIFGGVATFPAADGTALPLASHARGNSRGIDHGQRSVSTAVSHARVLGTGRPGSDVGLRPCEESADLPHDSPQADPSGPSSPEVGLAGP